MAIKTTWDNNDNFFVLGGEIADNRYARAFAAQEDEAIPESELSSEPQEAPEAEQGSRTPAAEAEPQEIPNAEDSELTTQPEPAAEPEVMSGVQAETESAADEAPEQVTLDNQNESEESKKPKKNKRPHKPIKHKRLLIAGLSAIILIVLILGGGWLYFRGRVLPNTYVANQNVAGLKQADLEKLVNNQQNSFAITIKGKKKTLKPNQKNIGLTFEANQTVTNTMAVHRTGSFWQHIMWWQRTNINLKPKVNQKELTKYLKANVKTATKKPQNAKIIFDAQAGQFETQKQVLGSGILVSKVTDIILNYAKTASSIEVKVPTQALPASITADHIQSSLKNANNYIKTPISLKLKGTTYTPSAAERASWLKFTVNKAKDDYDTKVLPAQISLYISGLSAPFHQDVTQRITIKNKTTGVKTVLQNGLNGQDVNNQAKVSATLAKAFTDQQSYSGDLKVTTTPYKTQDITALKKWAYVSLSTQTLTAYRYDKPVKSFLISSGVPEFATPAGVFKVWYKTPVQTMVGGSKASGDYYDLPHVHWDTYYDQDRAVHEAYWHHNFGHPMSHGCLNATYNDAHWFYDFAPIGTTVVVVQ